MKLDITIYLDSGRQISMTLSELLELRDKISDIAPRKEPAPFYVPPLPQPMYDPIKYPIKYPIKWAEPTSWPPKDWLYPEKICNTDNKGV